MAFWLNRILMNEIHPTELSEKSSKIYKNGVLSLSASHGFTAAPKYH
jgi:hypothetical protein